MFAAQRTISKQNFRCVEQDNVSIRASIDRHRRGRDDGQTKKCTAPDVDLGPHARIASGQYARQKERRPRMHDPVARPEVMPRSDAGPKGEKDANGFGRLLCRSAF